MNKILRLFFVTILLLIPSVTVSASCNIVIDGEELICRDALGNIVEPFIENGTTYVPVRAISGAFNTSVEWDMDTKTVFLGERSSEAQLGENINIFHNGKAFICKDVNGNTVHPILKEGTTFLPLRGIGELFGKTVAWDNINKSAVLTSSCTPEELNYLTNALDNTKKVTNLSQNLSFTGSLLYDNKTIGESSLSEKGAYSIDLFTLDSILPFNYKNNVVYKGEGNYFIYADSTKFAQTSFILAAQSENQQMNFSPVYINIYVKNGYIRTISVDTSYTTSNHALEYVGKINILTELEYPLSFRFPNIPYPDFGNGDSVFSQDVNDANLISETVDKYLGFAVKKSAKDVVGMLSREDYVRLFGQKSENQLSLNYQTITKKLNTIFRHASGEYEMLSMNYIDPLTLTSKPDKAAQIVLKIRCADKSEVWSEEIELLLIKLDGIWHIDSSVVKNLL